jgi:hypothetical protein
VEIPQNPLPVHYNNSGFLPHVGLHRRGGIYYQESSHSHRWLFAVMMFAAVVACFLPLREVAIGGTQLKYWIAGGCIWTGLCGFVPHFFRNTLGQTIIINPSDETFQIVERDRTEKISWRDIIGLQICHQKERGNSELNGYQLNLVWKDPAGTLKRHCLPKHSIRRFVGTMGKRYESHFGFKMLN